MSQGIVTSTEERQLVRDAAMDGAVGRIDRQGDKQMEL